ncbi:MAG TPA: DUF1653 domain-containing protein [Candidatus Babeliales bacterium]|nr:DUF1653 domain-containing protein [Candidatus Babeliales bacterium]
MKDFTNFLTRGTVLEHNAPSPDSHNPYRAEGLGRIVFGIGPEEYVVEDPVTLNVGGKTISVDPLFVVYRGMYRSETYGQEAIWIRPQSNMFEDIGSEGVAIPRFQIIGQDF